MKRLARRFRRALGSSNNNNNHHRRGRGHQRGAAAAVVAVPRADEEQQQQQQDNAVAAAAEMSTATTMEGSLSKWTNVVNGWQYRWFVLDDNAGLLSYYTVSACGPARVSASRL